MRLLALLLLVSSSACVTVAPRERAAILLPPAVWPSDTAIHWYDIEGDSAVELREVLDERGPEDGKGARHDAYTAWYVTWRYPFQQSDEGCATGPVTTSVRIDVTLPRWSAPTNLLARPLVRKWQRYLDALKEHESGHRETGFRAATDITERLSALPPKPTCDALEEAANALAREILEEHRRRDAQYDAETRHGATQGATFP